MVALEILRRFWKPLLALLIVVLAVWRVVTAIADYGDRKYTEGYDKREAEYADVRAEQAASQAKNEERREVRTNELVTDLGEKLDAIDARPAGPPVWMCPQLTGVPADTRPASEDSPASAHEASQGESAGAIRDIGPGTRTILDDGDSAIEQLTALQQWVTRECLRPPSTN